MAKFLVAVKKFIKGEEGPTMAEYGLLIALIAIVVIAAATLLGNSISSLFARVAASM